MGDRGKIPPSDPIGQGGILIDHASFSFPAEICFLTVTGYRSGSINHSLCEVNMKKAYNILKSLSKVVVRLNLMTWSSVGILKHTN